MNIRACTCVFRWLPEVHSVFYQGNKKKHIPASKLEDILETAAVMMSAQLRELVIDSVHDYQHMYSPLKEKPLVGLFPGFVVHIAIDGCTMQFEPCQKDFEVRVPTLPPRDLIYA